MKKYICTICNSSENIYSYTPAQWNVSTQRWELCFEDPLCVGINNGGCGTGRYGDVKEIQEDV
jgi:hypothetical protein|tara:strand:+ start:1178 stop:1366 length:189 start_codon:yes stop_codon:yes gene_type:complete